MELPSLIMTIKRLGQIIRLKPDSYEEYKQLHANVWADVLKALTRANIRNYSIYHWNGFLFAYMEYVGDNFEADMESIANDPRTREWWKLTDPLQQPVEGESLGSVDGNWWKDMEELFHTD